MSVTQIPPLDPGWRGRSGNAGPFHRLDKAAGYRQETLVPIHRLGAYAHTRACLKLPRC